jgi:hypothetical protein
MSDLYIPPTSPPQKKTANRSLRPLLSHLILSSFRPHDSRPIRAASG